MNVTSPSEGARYAKEFFDLQLTFAERVSQLSGLPFPHALFEYTNLYIRFGLGRDFDPGHPVWRAYVDGLEEANDRREWTYRFYVQRSGATTAPQVAAIRGCFSYALLTGDRLRLHFLNVEADGRPPLAAERCEQRVAELTALFAHARETRREPLRVIGGSWLYNLDAYRRLFPPAYVASARPVEPRFRHMPLWGQFLDRRGAVRSEVKRSFLESLERQTSIDRLGECFPSRVLALEAPVQVFYDFYGISPVLAAGGGITCAGRACY